MTAISANISFLFSELPLAERFGLAKLYGFDSVEIQFPYDFTANQIHDWANRADVSVSLINLPAGDFLDGGEGLAAVPGRQASFAEALEKAILYAQALGTRQVNVLPGRCKEDSRRAEYVKTFCDNLKKAADRLAEHNIRCLFEAINHHDVPGFLISSSADQLEVLEKVQHSNVFAQVDIYHMAAMSADGDVVASLCEILPFTSHIQFADWPGRGEPGTGTIDFEKVLKAIHDAGYDRFVAAEYKPTRNTPLTLDWLPRFRAVLNSGSIS